MSYYPAAPLLSIPTAGIPERSLPGWIIVVAEISPYYIIYAQSREKGIYMVARQIDISADLRVKEIGLASRDMTMFLDEKEKDIIAEQREKNIEEETRIKTIYRYKEIV